MEKIKEDWSFTENSLAKNIRKKLKSLFLGLATIIACLIFFYPPVTSLNIITGGISLLVHAGLHKALAHYVISVISGELIYACRAPFTSIIVGIHLQCKKSGQNPEPQLSLGRGTRRILSELRDNNPKARPSRRQSIPSNEESPNFSREVAEPRLSPSLVQRSRRRTDDARSSRRSHSN